MMTPIELERFHTYITNASTYTIKFKLDLDRLILVQNSFDFNLGINDSRNSIILNTINNDYLRVISEFQKYNIPLELNL
jgi:hypothetical protein